MAVVMFASTNYLWFQKKKLEKARGVKTYGVAAIGGKPWELVDYNGNRFSNLDAKGKYMLLYFGFTECPDVCPVELTKMSEVIDILGLWDGLY